MPRYRTTYNSAFPTASKILSKYEHERAFRLHRQKVINTKPGLDNKPPKRYPHMILRLKQVQKEEEKLAEVDHENKLLLQKMTSIMKTRGRVDNWNHEYETRSMNYPYKQRMLEQIATENMGIARRLEEVQPIYDVQAWESEYKRNRYLMDMWADSTKEYEETPRRSRNKNMRSKDFDDKYDDDFESEEEQENRSTRLPSIDEKQKKKDNRRVKSDSQVTKLPHIKDRKKSEVTPSENDAKELFKVAKQLAQPDEIIVKTLVRKSHNQRMQTKAKFKETYDLELDSELKQGLGQDWEILIDALLTEPGSSEVDAIHEALKNENIPAVVEILCTTNSSNLTKIKDAYRKEFAVSLESAIAEKTKDPVQLLLLTLQKDGRDDSTEVDEKKAEKDATALYEAGDGRWSSESGKFIKLLNSKSIPHVKATLRLYKQVSAGKDIMEDVKEDCDEDYAEAVSAFVASVKGSQSFYAEKLYKNLDASNPVFVKTLVTRSEIDMPLIRKSYKKKYDAELVEDIEDRCVHPTTHVLTQVALKSPPTQGKGKGQSNGKRYAGVSLAPPPKKQTLRRPENKKNDEDKTKNNPLSQPAKRNIADVSKKKDLDKDKKKDGKTLPTNGTIKPAKNFNPVSDAEKLHKAIDGFGTDEQAIIDVIVSKNNEQRQQLKKQYKEKYKKDLMKELESELRGDFEEVILALMMTPVEYDAYSLHDAMDGIGTNEAALIGILCTRSGKEIKAIKEQYKKVYKADLDSDIHGDTSGDFEEMLIELSKGGRDTGSDVNQKEAEEDAKELYKVVEEGGKPNEVFKSILVLKNRFQVKATSEEYKKLSNQDIFQAVTSSMSGDAKDGYLGLSKAIEDPIEFYAVKLHDSVGGAGTNDTRLIRIIVSRSEIDLVEIKAKYKELYGKTLYEMVESDCSGDYKRALLTIIGDKEDETETEPSTGNDVVSSTGNKQAEKREDPDGESKEGLKGKKEKNGKSKSKSAKTLKKDLKDKSNKNKDDGKEKNDPESSEINENKKGESEKSQRDESKQEDDYEKNESKEVESNASNEDKEVESKDGKGNVSEEREINEDGTTGTGDGGKRNEEPGQEKDGERIEPKGTISGTINFDAANDCKTLYEAMDGFGTEEDAIIKILTSRSNKQRQQLRKTYQNKYKKELIKELKSELSGNLEEAVLALMFEPVDYTADRLHEAMSGIGTDERLLTHLVIGATPEELNAVKKKYKEVYKKDLANVVTSETSGVMQKVLLKILEGQKGQSGKVNEKESEDAAKKLNDDGNSAFKYNIDMCVDILTSASPSQAKAIFAKYQEVVYHN